MNRLSLAIVFFLASVSLVSAQEAEDKLIPAATMYKPNLLSSHPLLLLGSRISQSFRVGAARQPAIDIEWGSGNVWEPPVKAFLPRDPAALYRLQQVPWHKRDSVYQLIPRNHDSMYFAADAVIKVIRLKFTVPLAMQHELQVQLRGFLLSGGKAPFSLLSNDAFIEKFHSHIAGGEDPFARKSYGYNKASIYYQDVHGRVLQWNRGDFVLPGAELSYYYYPQATALAARNIFINAGLHAGINLSSYNRSLDMGLSLAAQKVWTRGKRYVFNLATGPSLLRQRVLEKGNNVVYSSNPYLFSMESYAQLRKLRAGKRKSYFVGLSHIFMSAINRRADFEKVVLAADRISTHWHMAFSHLYRATENWTLVLGCTGKSTFQFYIKEDFRVDNAPDLQAGFAWAIPLTKMKKSRGTGAGQEPH